MGEIKYSKSNSELCKAFFRPLRIESEIAAALSVSIIFPAAEPDEAYYVFQGA